jgi:hypothetical protein
MGIGGWASVNSYWAHEYSYQFSVSLQPKAIQILAGCAWPRMAIGRRRHESPVRLRTLMSMRRLTAGLAVILLSISGIVAGCIATYVNWYW